MKRSRMLLLAMVAFTLSIAVTVVVYRALRDRLQPPDDMTQIVVARQDVSLGTRLTEADLRLAPWPRAVPLKGAFSEIGEVIGRGVVVSMIPNEPILDSKLAPIGAGAGLTTAIPEGMRAVGVKVNDVIGVAGFVLPGTRVDVILSGSPELNNEMEMSKVILENIQVLSAGQNVTRDSDGKPQSVQVVTLLVTPEDSQRLALASVDGKLQLSLRNPLDLASISPAAVDRAGLYGKAAPAPSPTPAPKSPARKAAPAPPVAPVAPAPPVQPKKKELQLIQGIKSETITFDLEQ